MAIIQSTTPSSYEYDVFLSFRGSDTRFGFTGNLYHALHARGIRTFIDDRELHGGDEITPSLFKAIEASMIAIVVFSKDYASSSFCLDELSHIMDCFHKNNQNRFVLPIFYGVEPTEIRHQTLSYRKAIADHEEKFQKNVEKCEKYFERLRKWKMALTQASNLSGYHLIIGSEMKEYEYKFIRAIVDAVSIKINRTLLHVADYCVGLDTRVLQVKSLLNMGSDGVRIVGIHGIGGIGKTTLAREVYNSIANMFEVCCFLEDVREKTQKHGLVHLQEILLHDTIGEKDIKLGSVSKGISIIKHRLQTKKTLLILDDVDDMKQLSNLVGEPHWLGPRSRVIITTRDTRLLASHGIETMYEVKGLNEEEALKLLRFKAFKNNTLGSKYERILKHVVTYSSGLPLALEVVGSTLSRKEHVEEWESLLSQYERIPHKDIQKILQVSYNALEKEEKSVFLDIACCFKGYELSEVEHILCAHYGECMKWHIQVLVEKSLVKIDSRRVTSHDLIEAMGKEIVRQESIEDPGKRSRLWFHEDIVQVLEDNTGGSQIKMMCLNFPFSHKKAEIEWTGDELKKMENIKTLIIKNGCFSKAPKLIPSSLKVLEWRRYPSPYFPSDFWPKKLSICKLQESCLTSFELSGSLKKFLNIKELNLKNCEYLTQIHDVSSLTNLENFSFEGCKNLTTIHDSVGLHLYKLKILNAQYCSKLKNFPPLKLTSLEELILSGCNSLKSFPEILGEMKNLTVIELRDTPIEELPFSFQNLLGIEDVELFGSGMLRLPGSIVLMPKLSWLYFHGYSHLLLKHNDDQNSMVSSNVTSISLTECISLDVFLPMLITWFTKLTELDLSWGKFIVLPECLKECLFLNSLNVNWCYNLQEIRGIPPNLKELYAQGCYSLSLTCRRMLLNQDLHENGGSMFIFSGTVRMPEWFEHQSKGPSISLWFRNKVPSISLCFVINWVNWKKGSSSCMIVNLFVNGCSEFCTTKEIMVIPSDDSSVLFDLQLVLQDSEFISKLEKELLNKEWIHAEVRFELLYVLKETSTRIGTQLLLIKSGIHVFEQKNNMEDIRFTNPYKKRKLDEYLNTSPSHFHPLFGEGWVSVNCSGVASHESNVTACGVIMCDHLESILSGFYGQLGEIPILHAELKAILYGIQFAWNRGYRKVIVESNSHSAIKLLRGECLPPDPSCWNLVMEILIYSSTAGQVLWSRPLREAIEAADRVANLGLGLSSDKGLITF